MKLFWKIFGSMFTVIIVCYALFSNLLIEQSFQSSLAEVRDNALSEMQMYLYTLILTVNEVGELGTIDDSLVGDVAKSVGKNSWQDANQVMVYDEEKKEIYSSKDHTAKPLDLKDLVIDREETVSDAVWWIEQEPEPSLEMVTAVIFPFQEKMYYIRFERNLAEVYRQREIFTLLYRQILGILFVVAGLFAFWVSYRIARPVQLLSRATKVYTGGALARRVKMKGNDEIAELTQDFNEMADRLQAMMVELQNQVHRQEEFTGAFAHELKTPLTSIIGYSEMMLLRNLEREEEKEAAQYIYREGKRLERLSQKMMELIQLDKIPQNMQEIEVQELMAQILQSVRFLLNKKKIQMVIQVDPVLLTGEKDLLMSLILNLLDNAWKACGEHGTITVIGAVEDGIYNLSVRDNGKGIPKEEIGKITDAFYMVDKSRARKQGGAGLGMAICKKISEVHQASLSVDSELGKGTTVAIGFSKWKKGEDME